MPIAPHTAGPGNESRSAPRRYRVPLSVLLGTWPNRLTALRLLLVPVLWVLALVGQPVYLGLLLAVAGITDLLDGYLARRLNQATEFGSRFDSLTDQLLAGSSLAWLLLLRPDVFREQLPLILIWLGIGGLALAVGWLRFGMLGGVHLYSAKTAVLVGLLFAIHLLITGTYSLWFFYLTFTVCVLAAAETLAVFLTRTRVDENIRSILLDRERR